MKDHGDPRCFPVFLVSLEQNVQECDATGTHSSNVVHIIKIISEMHKQSHNP